MLSAPGRLLRPAGTRRSLDALIAALFANSENGALFDASDLSSMRQGRDGSTAAAVGSPVGYWLDKRLMGGRTAGAFIAAQPELVTNGSGSNATGWAGSAGFVTVTSVDGWLRVTNVSFDGFVDGRQTLTTQIGVPIFVELQARVGANANSARVRIDGVQYAITTSTSATNLSFIFIPTTTNPSLQLQVTPISSTTGAFSEFRLVSVRELPGNHAIAPSDAARPILRATGKPGATGSANPELVTNGYTAENATTTITASTQTSFSATNASAATRAFLNLSGLTSGMVYRVNARVASTTATVTLFFRDGTGGSGTILASAPGSDGSTITFFVAATGPTETMLWATSGAATFIIDNISVRELTAAETAYYLEFDGVDDAFYVDGYSLGISTLVFAGAVQFDADGYAWDVGAAAGSAQAAFRRLGGNMTLTDDTGTNRAGGAIGAGSPHVISGRYVNNDALIRKDGVDDTAFATFSRSATIPSFTLGAWSGRSGGFLDGRIYRLIALPRVWTAAEQSNGERWLAQGPGVTL